MYITTELAACVFNLALPIKMEASRRSTMKLRQRSWESGRISGHFRTSLAKKRAPHRRIKATTGGLFWSNSCYAQLSISQSSGNPVKCLSKDTTSSKSFPFVATQPVLLSAKRHNHLHRNRVSPPGGASGKPVQGSRILIFVNVIHIRMSISSSICGKPI